MAKLTQILEVATWQLRDARRRHRRRSRSGLVDFINMERLATIDCVVAHSGRHCANLGAATVPQSARISGCALLLPRAGRQLNPFGESAPRPRGARAGRRLNPYGEAAPRYGVSLRMRVIKNGTLAIL